MNMPTLRQVLFAFALTALALLGLSACSTPPQDSSIPWSRPADWEGRIPGIGK
jgi:hypothetical protein